MNLPLTAGEALTAVASLYGVDVAEVTSSSTSGRLVEARDLVALLLVDNGWSLSSALDACGLAYGRSSARLLARRADEAFAERSATAAAIAQSLARSRVEARVGPLAEGAAFRPVSAAENPRRVLRHGTVSGYTYGGCKCDDCRAAKAAYERQRSARAIVVDIGSRRRRRA